MLSYHLHSHTIPEFILYRMKYKVKPSTFFKRGMVIAGFCSFDNVMYNATNYSRFRAHFGTSPGVCALCWSLIELKLPRNYLYTHLLWALLFLKVYATESVLSSKCCCDEKTFRTKVWTIIKMIDSIKHKVVSAALLYFVSFSKSHY